MARRKDKKSAGLVHLKPCMQFLDYLKTLFGEEPVMTGCLVDNLDELANLPDHELFGSSPGSKPSRDWSAFCPPFRWQGSSLTCTAYAGCTIASIFEKAETGKTALFSPLELFFRSKGSLLGNYLSNVAEALQYAAVSEEDVPTPVFDRWGTQGYFHFKALSKAKPEALERGRKYAIKKMASVRTDLNSLRAALQDSPLSVVVGVGKGYFNAVAPASAGFGALHNAVLVKIESDGRKLIFDSLTDRQGFDGFHYLAPDFPIISAFSYIDLPNTWRDVQPKLLPTYFLAKPRTGEIIPFRSKETVDYQMFLKAGYQPLN